MKTTIRRINDHGLIYHALTFVCPGCKDFETSGFHMLPVNSSEKTPSWQWNGDFEKPTLSPSILTRMGEGKICHSFLTDGVFHFLEDSTHSLAGQYIPIQDLEDWMSDD